MVSNRDITTLLMFPNPLRVLYLVELPQGYASTSFEEQHNITKRPDEKDVCHQEHADKDGEGNLIDIHPNLCHAAVVELAIVISGKYVP